MKRILVIFAGVVSIVIPLRGDAQTSSVRWWTVNMGFALGTSTNSKVVSVVGNGLVGSLLGPSSMIETGFLVDTLLRNTIVSVESPGGVPGEFSLRQNYPNPFNPVTIIRYDLPVAANTRLTVFNTLGQLVATLVNEKQQPGPYLVQFDGSALASGTYFYRLQAGTYTETKKLLLIR
ncbi:MAG TPA: T9SS type A sorting domain-containing protein [Bacteroidota bacterium]|nr:T9SS type A sorting domain-containing protein [Bacteroidota bacterium]